MATHITDTDSGINSMAYTMESLYPEGTTYLRELVKVKDEEITNLKLELATKTKVIDKNVIDRGVQHYRLKTAYNNIKSLKSLIEDNDMANFTDRVMDDAAKDIDKTLYRSKEKDMEKVRLERIIKEIILAHIKMSGSEYEFCEEGIDISRLEEHQTLISDILVDMNEEDWNGDDKKSSLIILDNHIWFMFADTDSDTDEPIPLNEN